MNATSEQPFDLKSFLDAGLVLDHAGLADARAVLRQRGLPSGTAQIRAVRESNRRWLVRLDYHRLLPAELMHLSDAMYLALRHEAARRNKELDWVLPRTGPALHGRSVRGAVRA